MIAGADFFAGAPPNPAPVVPPRAAVQPELRELVQQLKQLGKGKATEGIYRQLVRQGAEAGVTAEEFRAGLLAAGLKASRASELAGILDHCDATEMFLHPRQAWSFREVLRLARGQSPRVAKTKAERLLALAEELVVLAAIGDPWPFECGLFRLHFVPGGTVPELPAPEAATPAEITSAGPDEHLGIPLAPEIEEQLTRLTRHSGLSRADAAVELLQRAPWSELFAAIPPAAPIAERKFIPAPESRSFKLPPQQPATPPPPETFPVHRRKNARAFSLQRRKTPGRTPAYVCRLPVDLPAPLAAQLTQLGNACGLSRPEMANWLLEPDPMARVRAVQDALAAARAEQNANPNFRG